MKVCKKINKKHEGCGHFVSVFFVIWKNLKKTILQNIRFSTCTIILVFQFDLQLSQQLGKKFTEACDYYYGNNYSFNKFLIIEPSVLFQEWNGCLEREMTSCLLLSTLLTILSCGTSTNKPSCGRKGSWTTFSTFSSILSITTKQHVRVSFSK